MDKTDLTIRIIEAMAWTKKYLIAASVRLNINLLRIRGIILIRLISNPTQQVNQEFEEMATIVPATKKLIKIILYDLNNKKKEIYTLIKGVWTL